VIEVLIPVIDGFEHALAAHREAEYENYRRGFELIYKQLLENVAKLGAERVEPVGKPFDPHLHQADGSAPRRLSTRMARCCRCFSQGMCFTGACFAQRWWV
jgi:molecular chaperone GrpE (heat shock protein)